MVSMVTPESAVVDLSRDDHILWTDVYPWLAKNAPVTRAALASHGMDMNTQRRFQRDHGLLLIVGRYVSLASGVKAVERVVIARDYTEELPTKESVEGNGDRGRGCPSGLYGLDIVANSQVEAMKVIAGLVPRERGLLLAAIACIDWNRKGFSRRVKIRALSKRGYKKQELVDLMNRFGCDYTVKMQDIYVPAWWKNLPELLQQLAAANKGS